MSSLQRFLALTVLVSLPFTTMICTSGLAEESTLISIGPRIGFATKTPLLGRQQKYNFQLYDIAALWRLPWQVPDIALSGWNGLVSVDVGAGLGFFSKYQFGAQTFGGPVEIVATTGIRFNPVAHAYAGFRAQHFSDAGVYGPGALGVDMWIVEFGYRF